MLKQRLLTAAVLLPLTIWCVLALPTQYFALCTALVVLAGAWEWAGLVGLTARSDRFAYLALMAAAILGAAWLATIPLMRQLILAGAAVWWITAMMWIRRFNLDPQGFLRTIPNPGPLHLPPHWLFALLGIVVLVPAWTALLLIHGSEYSGGYLVLFLMVLVWGADTGAYVAGRMWGRTKLAPGVSPGKTWEGVYGALVTASATAVVSGLLIGLDWRTLVTLVLLGFLTVLFSIIGDLFESMVKRLAGVKDSGHLLPGHGGVLDRIDSLTAAAPVFALGLLWQGVLS